MCMEHRKSKDLVCGLISWVSCHTFVVSIMEMKTLTLGFCGFKGLREVMIQLNFIREKLIWSKQSNKQYKKYFEV